MRIGLGGIWRPCGATGGSNFFGVSSSSVGRRWCGMPWGSWVNESRAGLERRLLGLALFKGVWLSCLHVPGCGILDWHLILLCIRKESCSISFPCRAPLLGGCSWVAVYAPAGSLPRGGVRALRQWLRRFVQRSTLRVIWLYVWRFPDHNTELILHRFNIFVTRYNHASFHLW